MAEQAMEKLANELIERLAAVESDNATLTKANEELRALTAQMATVKQASQEIKQVDDGLLDTTCKNLVKSGALNADQVEQAKAIFKSDPNASFKVIQSLLDERAQVKTAADQAALSGGSLVRNRQKPTNTPEEACLDRMFKTLGLY